MKKDLINKLQSARKLLLKAITLYPRHPKGEWSRKELLSHIAGWDEEFDKEIGAVPKILKGERPISFNLTVDHYNKRSIEKRKNKSERQILQEISRRHKQRIKMIQKLSEHQITGFHGTKLRGKPVNVLWVINETISHDNEHAKEIMKKYAKK